MTTAASTPLPTPPAAGRNLPAAIGVGLTIFSAVVVGLLVIPWLFIVLVAAALGISAVEVHQALERKGMHATIVPIVFFTVVSILGGYALASFDVGITPISFVVICIAAMTLASMTARLRKGPEGFLRDVAASALIIVYIPLMGVFVPLLMAAENGAWRLVALITCVVVSDTAAYAVGSLLGRHKLAPQISPSKTWEGVAGSVVFSALAGILLAVFLLGTTWWVGLILGVALALAGTLGDLVESLIKRDAGIKDMSNFLPGHGGVMDRLDSMLVAIPVGWFVLHLALGA